MTRRAARGVPGVPPGAHSSAVRYASLMSIRRLRGALAMSSRVATRPTSYRRGSEQEPLPDIQGQKYDHARTPRRLHHLPRRLRIGLGLGRASGVSRGPSTSPSLEEQPEARHRVPSPCHFIASSRQCCGSAWSRSGRHADARSTLAAAKGVHAAAVLTERSASVDPSRSRQAAALERGLPRRATQPAVGMIAGAGFPR